MEQDNRQSHESHTVNADSPNSGVYSPGKVAQGSEETGELSYVEAQQMDIMLEEFPEGPFGAATSGPVEGKSTPWQPGQRKVSAYRDQNPDFSNRKVPLDKPSTDGNPLGTIEGQN